MLLLIRWISMKDLRITTRVHIICDLRARAVHICISRAWPLFSPRPRLMPFVLYYGMMHAAALQVLTSSMDLSLTGWVYHTRRRRREKRAAPRLLLLTRWCNARTCEYKRSYFMEKITLVLYTIFNCNHFYIKKKKNLTLIKASAILTDCASYVCRLHTCVLGIFIFHIQRYTHYL